MKLNVRLSNAQLKEQRRLQQLRAERQARRAMHEMVTYLEGDRYVTFHREYEVKTASHVRFKEYRCYERGDYCEWPVCDLTNELRPVNHGVRILINKEDGGL